MSNDKNNGVDYCWPNGEAEWTAITPENQARSEISKLEEGGAGNPRKPFTQANGSPRVLARVATACIDEKYQYLLGRYWGPSAYNEFLDDLMVDMEEYFQQHLASLTLQSSEFLDTRYISKSHGETMPTD